MAFTPITGSALQYMANNVGALDHYIKFYVSGTSTPISMSIDSTGGTLLAKAQFDAQGYALNGSSAPFIPHIDQKYKIVFYPDAATADANDFSSAVFEIDLLNPFAVLTDSSFIKNFATLAIAVADTSLIDGDSVNIAERTVGNNGGAMWDVVLASTVTPNALEIVQCTGVATLALVMRDEGNLAPFSTTVGLGVKGNPQTNVGLQIHRDITNEGTSSHGVNVADYFADDTRALNSFGSDIQIGDGTQTTEVINHVNDFQATDKINLGGATITSQRAYTAQNLLESGTIGTVDGFGVTDVLGGRDTPGFSTPNFEVDGTATVNNQTGIRTLIRHGVNPRSIHCAAGNTDAGALLNSGGAPVDLECPVTIRQATDATNTVSGALILTAGGMGAAGSIFGTNEISVNGVGPLFRLRNVANSSLGRVFHNATDLLIYNDLNNTLKLGVNNSPVVEVKSDRFIPTSTATLNHGDTSHRWIQSFVTIAENVSSDRNTKTEIEDISDTILDAWGDVLAKTYKRKISVDAKGDAARSHMGYIAQDVEDAFAAKGLNPFDYSLISFDDVTEDVVKTRTIQIPKVELIDVERITFDRNDQGELIRKVATVQEEKPVYEQLAVLNEDGTPYLDEMVPVVQSVQVMVDAEEEYTETVPTGEKTMGLRYSECLVIEGAYLRREIGRIQSAI